MPYNKPLPIPNPDTATFWKECRNHRLTFQQCLDCSHVRWPPSLICPQCHSAFFKNIESNGRGIVYTFVVYHQAFHPAFKEELPYVAAVVQLEEGPRIVSNLIACTPDEVFCDMQVELVWEDITDKFSLPKFKPVADV